MAASALPDGFSDFAMSAFGTVLFVEGLLGFCLNATAALSFLLIKDQRTPSNFLVFNLNISDLMLNINALIGAYASYVRVWPYGTEGCNIHGFEGSVAIYATISFVALIAWDKYHYWCTKQEFYWATSGTMCVGVWVASIFWAALPLPSFGWGEYDFEPMRTCCCLDYTEGDWKYASYMLTIAFVYLLVPWGVMRSSYDSIYAYFKKTHSFKFNTFIPEATLFATWGPYLVLLLYSCVADAKTVSPQFRMVLPVWAKTSTIFNAFIYSYTNKTYKDGIWRLLGGGQKIAEKNKTF
ncbi:RPE-retinal G protein-coupled receptor-like [Engraulis encrasicolus]|uniref:RPE-retinal G protein-coupled receptor-like n=1 Tax=Engraulis encrasicolus TaxID=184585 RepID=UPI002FCF7F59